MNRIFKEIYNYRQMIFSLVRKDLRGRYKGSVLGFMWTFINPLLQLMVYTIVFSVIMRNGIEQYYLFLFVALVPWIFFSSALTGGSTSILGSGDMVKKIYFPREVLPMAYITSSFVNMVLSFLVVFAVLLVTGYGFNPAAQLMPIWRLNPMTPVIDAYRDILYYKQIPKVSTLTEALLLGIFILVVGEIVFSRLQRGFAEEL